MTTGIGLDRQVLRHRYVCCQFGLLLCDLALVHQFCQQLIRRRAEPLAGDLDARGLGNNTIGGNDVTLLVLVDALHPVANHRQG